MNKPLVQEWSAEDVSDLLLQVRGGSVAERRAAVKSVNWARDDLRQLGWMMSQKDIDLATAVRVFLNGNPERFQYVGARNLPEDARERCKLLDAIHKRIISGFYLPDPEAGVGAVRDEMLEWTNKQAEDKKIGKSGRWQFSAAMFEPIKLETFLGPSDARAVLDPSVFGAMPPPERRSFIRDVWVSLFG